MCILRKSLPYNKRNKKRIEKLPRIYLVACLARWGVIEHAYAGKNTKNGIPLVYQFDDHNGTHWEYCLRRITDTTTGATYKWFFDKNQALYEARQCEKRRLERSKNMELAPIPYDFEQNAQDIDGIIQGDNND